ncbi:Testis-expressed sequence 10 protein [Actinidia chinensis var. chinensis]|uniref:Testis-expressed sequence 10 protein n=1 Tax=Actinidia chinensis var. chinensis TaxID=1590841 RepID=A0A2R6RK72_ACTCC|nr:Testis-expressed sequence 10 protein [Actinidia chinensis var. chinensis]
MVKPKVVSKKQQKRGVDFKKIKRKVGRKLPPPKNTTNTEIKSKAIILPEQSVASEKAGLAVSKKGLTLKELLQQTSHHNPKVRKDALIGIRDILLKYPTELRSHKLAIIEKLRERISDDDKVVRETLYQLLKSVVFPGCKEDTQGPFISLMMAYIFNAMTHLAIDVRLMAFNFFDLVLQHYPSCFSLYAEKIFQNYEDILRKNQFYLQDKGKLMNALGGLVHCLLLLPSNKGDHDSPCEKDKGKLMNALGGLVHCLLLLPSNKGDHDSPCEKDAAARGILHAFESETHKDPAEFCVINKKLKEFVPVLISCFQDFIRLVHTMPHLDAQSFDCMLSILQSIDHVVRFFAYWIENSQQELQVSMPPNEGPDATIQGLTITPSLLKKLFDLFPLNPKRHLSGKSIDHVVRFFAYWIENSQQELQVSMPPNEGPDATIQGLTITPSLLKKLFDLFPLNPKRHLSGKDDDKYFVLNVIITEIFLCSSDCLYPPAALLEKFLEFIASALTKNICSGRPSGKAFYEKQILSLIPFTPKLLWQVSGYWKSRILQAFTNIFRSCNLESSLKWACLSAIEEMLVPRQGLMYLDASDQELLDYQITWIRELPLLLIMLGDKHPLRSRSVLRLLLRLGQCAASNPSFAQEYDNMQYSFAEFYCICMGERNISYGPFVRLDTDDQELSVCCLYYLFICCGLTSTEVISLVLLMLSFGCSPRQGLMYLDASDQELLDYQITWIRELPLLLIMLGDKHPLRSRSVLRLLLRLGQCAASNPSFAQEYDNMQYSFAEFYCICMGERNISYGPFVRVDTDAQELSVCCLYYLSAVDSHLLKSLAWSCLYDGLEPFIIFRMIEVLHSAYKVGHIQIADHISFFITLLSYFKAFPGMLEKSCPMLKNDEISNHGTFMSVTSAVCSCLLQMGDDYLVFQILEKVVLDQLPLKPALDNSCALLRVLVALDSRSTRLSQQSIMNLGNFLPGYLIDVVTLFPEYDDKSLAPVIKSTCHYYLLPCYFLFYRNNKLLNLLLNMMASLVTEKGSSLSSFASDHSSRISAILSVVLLMHKDVKIRKILSSCKAEVDLILQNILAVQPILPSGRRGNEEPSCETNSRKVINYETCDWNHHWRIFQLANFGFK